MPKRVIAGFDVYVHLRGERGHRPHVHVYGNSGRLVILLDPVSIYENTMKDNEARRAFRAVAKERAELLELWRKHHGD